MPRPCDAADLVEFTPAYSGGFDHQTGAAEFPLPFDPTPWRTVGPSVGFPHAFVVRRDHDWDQMTLEPGSAIAIRYVLVPVEGNWELRLGSDDIRRVEAGTGGMHRHMFSVVEEQAANASGTPIRSGYIYAILRDRVTIG